MEDESILGLIAFTDAVIFSVTVVRAYFHYSLPPQGSLYNPIPDHLINDMCTCDPIKKIRQKLMGLLYYMSLVIFVRSPPLIFFPFSFIRFLYMSSSSSM